MLHNGQPNILLRGIDNHRQRSFGLYFRGKSIVHWHGRALYLQCIESIHRTAQSP